MLETIVHETTVVRKAHQRPTPGSIHLLEFTNGEWNAFSNGMYCAALGMDTRQLRQVRNANDYGVAAEAAFNMGVAKVTKLFDRPDVQNALAEKFSGETAR